MMCSPGTVTAAMVGGPLDGKCRWLDGRPEMYWELAAGGPVVYRLGAEGGEDGRPVYTYRGRHATPGMQRPGAAVAG